MVDCLVSENPFGDVAHGFCVLALPPCVNSLSHRLQRFGLMFASSAALCALRTHVYCAVLDQADNLC